MSRVPDLSDLDLQLEDVEDYSSEYPTGEADIRNTAETNAVKNQRRGLISSMIMANKKLAAVAGAAIIVLIGIIAYSSSSSGGDDEIYAPLILVDPGSVDPAISQMLMPNLISLYDRYGIDKSVLGPESGDDTPQRRAFFWWAKDYDASQDHSTRITRFALAAFYYSTMGIPSAYEDDPGNWFRADKWMSKSHVCDWQGVECNDALHVTGISLERNNVSGYLPVELLILSDHLETIDLSANAMYMEDEDYDVFTFLPNLKTLLMDDNYLRSDDGLPTQMSALVNLKKLRLSYNLIQGELESDPETPVLAAMTQLTHLEMESCFLTGTMPDLIGTMDQLVYLYLRRNDMEFNLDFLATGQMSSLFAVWLDANTITGTIPTEIGLLDSLASVSMTNSTISGTIPTEMGMLTDLRRLWLYGNDLTGSIPTELQSLEELEVFEVHDNDLEGDMPGGVCNIIQSSNYEFKSLTSDCKSSVQCNSGCCTKCY